MITITIYMKEEEKNSRIKANTMYRIVQNARQKSIVFLLLLFHSFHFISFFLSSYK